MKSLARKLAPAQIPLFPLKGTVLMPGCDLPLNIFEPRYLNMVDDALTASRLIGIIQPAANPDDNTQGYQVEDIGTLGRIRQFTETDDGRYLIVLTGLKRFRFVRSANSSSPYRQALVSYSGFTRDADMFEHINTPNSLRDDKEARPRLINAMKAFATSLGVQLSWDSLEKIPLENLVDQSIMMSPFEPADKQSLLEGKDVDTRRHLLIGLMELYASRTRPTPHAISDDNGQKADKSDSQDRKRL